MAGVLGRFGKHGRTTLYVSDVKTFYLDEDIPKGYERRELPVSQWFRPYSLRRLKFAKALLSGVERYDRPHVPPCRLYHSKALPRR